MLIKLKTKLHKFFTKKASKVIKHLKKDNNNLLLFTIISLLYLGSISITVAIGIAITSILF